MLAMHQHDAQRVFFECFWCDMLADGASINLIDLILFADLNNDADFTLLLIRRQYLVSVDTAPGWNVMQHAGIGCQDSESITYGKLFNGVLGFDHGHRAQQASCIQCLLCHVAHLRATSYHLKRPAVDFTQSQGAVMGKSRYG